MEKKEYKALFIILAAYIIIEMAGITCPIKFLTGCSCGGCGMSRAMLALLRLDFAAAFYYHPLFILPFLCVIIFLLRKRIPEKLTRSIGVIFITMAVVVWIYRLLDPACDIVTFNPKEGAIAKLLVLLFS